MSDELKTKYPIVLVHGAGFRDLKTPLYWGRIPKALEAGGAKVYYGLQDGIGGVRSNAEMLAKRLPEILKESGAGKVNIIAHSKGGVEARYVASSLGMGHMIASITTVATPHHGMKTVEKLFKIPRPVWSLTAFAARNWYRVFGDREPDLIRLADDLTPEKMRVFNEENPDVPGIFYQSFGTVMKRPTSDINLMTANFAVKKIEGDNDGVVTVESSKWGENFRLITANTNRGISHLDSIDFRRSRLSKKTGPGVSDIVDLYKEIVRDLKDRGL
ncbi:MAG: hypothetical protein K6F68_08675 [Clostridiales bacterium]|nr:hypothetical protein [Clostridiales bacterium]